MKRTSILLQKTSTTFLSIIVLLSTITAQTTNWLELSVDNDWANAANWDNGVPTSSTIANIGIDIDSILIKPGTNAFAKSVFVTGTDILFTIGGNASLKIESSPLYGIYNFSGNNSNKIVNQGYLEITGTTDDAIYNLDSMLIVYPGEIYIFDCNSNAINNDGYFFNDGYIDLENPGEAGFYNQGVFENKSDLFTDLGNNGIINTDSIYNNGNIKIFDIKGRGLNNQENAIIINQSSIEIDSTDEIGLLNENKIINYDSIKISKAALHGLYNNNDSSIENFGVIDIKNITSHGISNYGLLTNNHKTFISLADIGVYNNGTYLNIDSTVLDSITSVGFSNYNSFTNSNGVVKITNMICVPCGSCISNQNSALNFTNNGEILLSDCMDRGILNFDTIQNYGLIDIKKTNNYGLWNLVSSFFINEASGTINISDINYIGLRTYDKMVNEGMIKISDIGSIGIRLYADFLNFDTILINNVDDEGVVNSGGEFHNHALSALLITNVNGAPSNGFRNFDASHLINEGMLSIKNSGARGFFNESGTVTNSDTILIENSAWVGLLNSDSIHVSSTGYIGLDNIQGLRSFINQANSTILIDGEMSLNGAQGIGIENAGNIFIGSTGTLSTNSIIGDFLICELNSTLDSQGIVQIE